MSIVKSQIIDQLADNYPNFLRKDLKKTLNLILDEIISGLIKNNNVEIRGFGTFNKKINKEKFVRNPKTNEKIFKKETHKIHFKIGKILHKRINSIDT